MIIKNKKVKKALIDADLTVVKLSEVTGYTRPHLSNVINGNIDSIRAKKVIALATRQNFKELWTDQDK